MAISQLSLYTHPGFLHARYIAREQDYKITSSSLLVVARDLVDEALVEVELPAEDLLVDRIRPSTSSREVQERDDVHGSELKTQQEQESG